MTHQLEERAQALALAAEAMYAEIRRLRRGITPAVTHVPHIGPVSAPLPKPDRWAKEREAFAQGKVIEHRAVYDHHGPSLWRVCHSPLFSNDPRDEYRVRPEPPAPDPLAEVKAAHRALQPIQVSLRNRDEWQDFAGDHCPNFDNENLKWRVKPAEMQHLLPPWASDAACLHNPDNLTPEQVGEGWRLLLPEEIDGRHRGATATLWLRAINPPQWGRAELIEVNAKSCTYRVPASTPWPEAPKPAAITPQRADKFKRGDKVRVKPIGVEATGAILHVFEMSGSNVHVGESADATHGPWYTEEELELVPATSSYKTPGEAAHDVANLYTRSTSKWRDLHSGTRAAWEAAAQAARAWSPPPARNGNPQEF